MLPGAGLRRVLRRRAGLRRGAGGAAFIIYQVHV